MTMTVEEQRDRLLAALEKIERWEMPPCNHTMDDGRPMSFALAYGSQGEKEHIRKIAHFALADCEEKPVYSEIPIPRDCPNHPGVKPASPDTNLCGTCLLG